MGERLIAFQRNLAAFDRPNPWPGHRHLAATVDHVPFVMTPASRLPIRLMPASCPGELLDLLVDQGLHHQQTCLRGRLFDGPCDLRQQRAHRQHHLERGLALGHLHPNSIGGEVLQFPSGTTRLSLVACAHHAVLSYE